MSTFVDFVGMNTLISSSFDDSNILTSERNTELASIPVGEELVGINLHRNGPYGYSTWKQLRASENPISRHHRETNKLSFVIQPGEIRNVLSDGELRVRDRYSVLYNFTEPAICQKAYPLVWNVGRHFKDEDGNVDINNPNKFSIISSYGNQQIGFANEQANKLLKFDIDEDQTEYAAIKDMYLENGLNKQDSPLTYWEFLQYRETVFPKEQQQFVAQARKRPQFESFYRHNLNDRIKFFRTSSFGYSSQEVLGEVFALSQSSWPLDEGSDFLTINYSADDRAIFFGSKDFTNPVTNAGHQRRGEGVLQNTLVQYNISMASYQLNDSNFADVQTAAENLNNRHSPSPLYSRRGSINATGSVANPSGMVINHTGTGLYHLFQGSAVWDAGVKRQIKDADGNYISSPKYPFYDTYEHYSAEMQNYGKNYVVLPEFRMSSQIEDYKRTDGGIELDMFEVTGGVSGSENSSKANFYEIYSNSDFMKNFEIIASDHEEFTNGKVLSVRCKAIKKFLPYEGFYPCQRTVDLTQRFYDSYKDNIKVVNESGIEVFNENNNFAKQIVMTPLFAPGLLFNTIKSGIAVDFPVMTGSLPTVSGSLHGEYIDTNLFDKRIPFEALIEPKKHLSNYKLTSNEPHAFGNLKGSAVWDGHGDDLYSMMANNFLAEVPEFFLPKGQLTSVVSKKQKRIKDFEVGEIYAMRVKMRRSMGDPRISVYHSGRADRPYTPPQDIILREDASCRENFTMYSRPNAFGPPTFGYVVFDVNPFHFDQDGYYSLSGLSRSILKSSESGYNFPFTPPYYHGEAWCEMWMTASKETMTIKEIQNSITSSFSRFDDSFYTSNGAAVASAAGAQAIVGNRINLNAVQLSASLNLFGVGTIKEGNTRAGSSIIVDTGEQEDNRWVIQTKFETPMLNFNHITGSEHLTLPFYSSGSVARGMWHQYGRIPEENEGVFLEVGSVPQNYQAVVGLGGIKRSDDGSVPHPSIVLAADSGFNVSALQTDATVLRFHRNNEQTTTTAAAGLKFEIDFDTSVTTVVRATDGTDSVAKITCGVNGLSNITEVLAKVEDAIDSAVTNGDIADLKVTNNGSTLTIENTKIGSSSTDQLVISDSGNTDDQFHATGVDPASGATETDTGLRNGTGVAAVGSPLERTNSVRDLSEHLGFSGTGTKIGRLASAKKISEAVVAVPFVMEEGRKKFFKIDPEKVSLYKEGKLEALTQGTPQSQIGRSVLLQLDKMKKFIFPPSFDFLNFDDVDPIAMYVFEFTHTLTQQDLSDIWQNLPPDIGTEMEVVEVAITHPLLKKELLGQGGEGGNKTIQMPDKLKWMVFKVKQRAASNYFKKTVLRNPEVNTKVFSGNVTKDEFGSTSNIQYNWPYDFFSLVEMAKIEAEVEMGNVDFSNYTDNIPQWNAVIAEPEKIAQVVGGMEDDPVVATPAVDEAVEEGTETNETNLGEGISAFIETLYNYPPAVSSTTGGHYVNFKLLFAQQYELQPEGDFNSMFDQARRNFQGSGFRVYDEYFNTTDSFLLREFLKSWYAKSRADDNDETLSVEADAVPGGYMGGPVGGDDLDQPFGAQKSPTGATIGPADLSGKVTEVNYGSGAKGSGGGEDNQGQEEDPQIDSNTGITGQTQGEG